MRVLERPVKYFVGLGSRGKYITSSTLGEAEPESLFPALTKFLETPYINTSHMKCAGALSKCVSKASFFSSEVVMSHNTKSRIAEMV